MPLQVGPGLMEEDRVAIPVATTIPTIPPNVTGEEENSDEGNYRRSFWYRYEYDSRMHYSLKLVCSYCMYNAMMVQSDTIRCKL